MWNVMSLCMSVSITRITWELARNKLDFLCVKEVFVGRKGGL